MKNIKSNFIAALLLILFVQSIYAEVKLPAIVSSNMVLQRNTSVVLWGWADPQEEITIETSWLGEALNLTADNEGNWQIEVQTNNNKEPQTIKIQSKTSSILLDNILFGEVWLCSGQSNMSQSLKGYTGQPTFGSNMAIAKSNNSYLRIFTVNRAASKTPLQDVDNYLTWQEAAPDNVSNFSAIAYFFGQQLQEILDVPVGMIHTSWGGSSVQAWMSKDVMSNYIEVNLENTDLSKRTNQIPTVLFNAMINPVIPFTIKGALWYQGESNREEPENYKKYFPAMVKDWRNRWENGDFPFYYAQIAPFIYDGNDLIESFKNSAFIREAQLQCLNLIPNSGIAITMDIGEENFIHPPKKKEVADRLLFNALNQTYGHKTVAFASPIFDSKEVKGDELILTFKNAESGLYSYNQLEGFEIAGEDKVFYSAKAKITNRKNVSIKSDKVPNPVAVRYAWRNWISGTLYNANLLPASSFRTDEWKDATHFKN